MVQIESILVTGGTGSFGRRFVRTLLENHPNIKRVVVYSRDELKQFEMASEFPEKRFPQLRMFIGDIRDRERLILALEGIDTVVHAAALKQVPACEYNPFEAIKTNILGAQNLIDACRANGVHRVVALSTDKAAAPINLYGATKLCSDKLFVAANHYTGSRDLKFSVVRYGNVVGSRGSVFPFFLKKRAEGVLPITDRRMTRFNITLRRGVDMVFYALANMWGGEIFVPKIPSFRVVDLAEAIGPECRHECIGIRPGEKLHEEMITPTDALSTLDCGDHYVILPSLPLWDVDAFAKRVNASPCPEAFSYNSGDNTEWLSVEDLRDMVRRHVDPDFTV